MRRTVALLLACVACAAACTPAEKPERSDGEQPGRPQEPTAAAPSVAPPRALPELIAEIVKDPRSLPSRSIQTGRDASGLALTAFTYELPGVEGPVLVDVLDRDKGAWICVLGPGAGGPKAIAPRTALAQRIESRAGSRWSEVTQGPLAGAFIEEKRGSASTEVKSVAWILAHEDAEIGGWLCHEGRVPGLMPRKPADLEQQCQALVRAKLYYKSGLIFSGALSGSREIKTSASCSQTWNGWAESDTPWGRHKRDFTCAFEPKKGKLTLAIEGP